MYSLCFYRELMYNELPSWLGLLKDYWIEAFSKGSTSDLQSSYKPRNVVPLRAVVALNAVPVPNPDPNAAAAGLLLGCRYSYSTTAVAAVRFRWMLSWVFEMDEDAYAAAIALAPLPTWVR